MNAKILNKELLTDVSGVKVFRLTVYHPDIAKRALPGQFVVLMVEENGERIPLTIVDADKSLNSVVLIFQELGLSTKLLGALNIGDHLFSLAGPMGHPTDIKNFGKVILVGGGIGIAEIYPVAKALKEKGNYVVSILGSRTRDLLILEEKMKGISDELHIATDDGSYGTKGFSTDILKNILNKSSDFNIVYSVGPIPMMKAAATITKPNSLKTLVSLNALMVDATGMCGSCRVTVGGKTRFSCVDGPEFDAHEIDWEELEKRNKIYYNKEKHICKLNLPSLRGGL